MQSRKGNPRPLNKKWSPQEKSGYKNRRREE